MSAPTLTLMKVEVKTMGPLDICANPGPLGVPMPAPAPGENIPMMWVKFVSKVLIEGMPVLVEGSEGPLCKPHTGTMMAMGPGMVMGLGKLAFILTGAMLAKFQGKLACNQMAMCTHNSNNAPPAQPKKGSTKVKTT